MPSRLLVQFDVSGAGQFVGRCPKARRVLIEVARYFAYPFADCGFGLIDPGIAGRFVPLIVIAPARHRNYVALARPRRARRSLRGSFEPKGDDQQGLGNVLITTAGGNDHITRSDVQGDNLYINAGWATTPSASSTPSTWCWGTVTTQRRFKDPVFAITSRTIEESEFDLPRSAISIVGFERSTIRNNKFDR